MRILMRADLNANIGQGHVMRLLSLADAFVSDPENDCAFVIASDTAPEPIESRGYQVFHLSSVYTEMEKEIGELKDICESFQPDYLFVDSYYVTENYLNSLRKLCKTVYLDDVYAFAYPVDILVNYNVYANEAEYKKLYSESGTDLPKLLLGPSYAPLRKEFGNPPKGEVNDKVKRIAVSFGGADPMHMAYAFLKSLYAGNSSVKNAEIHMILGVMEPDLERIKELASEKENLILHINTKEMKDILQSCDLAISAAGSTQYEICACRVPCVNFSMADNQLPGGEEFGRRGIMEYVGDVRNHPDFYENLIACCERLSNDYERRVRMVEAECALVDGLGAKRLAGEFIAG